MAVGELGPFSKHLQVESPEPTDANRDNGECLGQTAVQPMLTQIAMAQHATKVILHLDLVEFGAAKEEMALPQTVGEPMGDTEAISIQESVVLDAWNGWWESLRVAHRMQWVTAAALNDESRGGPMVHVKKLMQEEAEKLEIWRG